MSVTIDNISSGSYGGFEGPYFKGIHKYVAPKQPDVPEKFLATIAATEGSAFDAINMYDRMIVSVGTIQWGEAGQFSVSDMLGLVAERVGIDYINRTLEPALTLANAKFTKTAKGKWRFVFYNRMDEVDCIEKQRLLFLSCSGKQGAWTETSKRYAKTWAMCLANVWDDPRAREAQIEYTKKRLMGFVTPKAKEILFFDVAQNLSVGWCGAVRAAYLSFAANLPAVAAEQLEIACKNSTYEKWSESWCISVIKQLTFGPGIKIYPGRYDKIRPVIENYFDVKLPQSAAILKDWSPPPSIIPKIIVDYTPTITVRDDPLADAPLVAPTNLFMIVIKFFTWLFSLFTGAKK